MKSFIGRASVLTLGLGLLLLFAFVTASGGATPAAHLAGTLTPSAWSFLPVIAQEPTPTFTSTPQAETTGNVVIVTVFYNGTGSAEPDEYVEIRNNDSHAIQMEGWTVRDVSRNQFTFPAYIMQPGQTCRVYTNEDHPEWCGFNYHSGSPIWNDIGDTAFLRDSDGALIDTYKYAN